MKQIHFLKPIIICVIFFLLSTSCESNQENTEKTIIIASVKAYCIGVAPQRCLLIKESENQNWEYFYDTINGFTHQEGFEYVVSIREEQISNPPQDASSIKTTLIKIISKTEKNSVNLPD